MNKILKSDIATSQVNSRFATEVIFKKWQTLSCSSFISNLFRHDKHTVKICWNWQAVVMVVLNILVWNLVSSSRYEIIINHLTLKNWKEASDLYFPPCYFWSASYIFSHFGLQINIPYYCSLMRQLMG